jgi:group I intron endonuclease
MEKELKYNTGIYIIENKIDGKKYVGSAVNLKKRLYIHKNSLIKNTHINRHLQRAWNKYGEENFVFKPILYCDGKNLLFFEQRAIDTYGFENLYNLCPTAGNNLGVKLSAEHNRKLSESRKGEKNPLYGKHLSDEHRKKLSNSHKGEKNPLYGKHLSDEHRKKLSEAHKGEKHSNYGKHLSDETKKKISGAQKGKQISDETRKKLSETHKGKQLSNETKKKMSNAHKGEKHPLYGKNRSDEIKKKISEAVKKTFARKKAEKLSQQTLNQLK